MVNPPASFTRTTFTSPRWRSSILSGKQNHSQRLCASTFHLSAYLRGSQRNDHLDVLNMLLAPPDIQGLIREILLIRNIPRANLRALVTIGTPNLGYPY